MLDVARQERPAPNATLRAEMVEAFGRHQAGELAAAARGYQGILAREPNNADAAHLLGVILHQPGQSARAVELINRDVALRPSVPAFHANLESVSRRLIAACGLEWEPACLDFHQTRRPVRTASVTQVRQPVYRKSLDRWKNYQASLAGLFAALPPSLHREPKEMEALI